MEGDREIMAEESRCCVDCSIPAPRSSYSRKQWSKGPGGRCIQCVQRQQDGSSTGSVAASVEPAESAAPTALRLDSRPQRAVPGFKGLLTVARDWPQTKRGSPPGSQSAIFNPLLACVIGPVEGHCTAAQLAAAAAWWARALPAWPRWVAELAASGVAACRTALLASAKGQPNPLIFKTRGHGTAPHFKVRPSAATAPRSPLL